MQSVVVVVVSLAIWTSTNAVRLSPHGRELLFGLASRSLSPTDITEDAILDITAIVEKNGYPIKEYKAATEDGYNVTIFNIPNGKKNCTRRRPVFLMHGMYSSSGAWILLGPDSSLAYLLVEECFDVWLGNSRGSYYSRNPNDAVNDDFWKFSYHHIGYYDLPAMIDFVLKTIDEESLHYVGHSQGTTEFFVMTSSRPRYNDKIISMVAFAPVAYTSHVKNDLFRVVANESRHVDVFKAMVGNGEFVPSGDFVERMAEKFCRVNSKFFKLCTNFNFQLGGIDPRELKEDMVSTFNGHEPGGGSIWELYHHLEDFHADNFRQFNRGIMQNIETYGETEPPPYNLTNVVVPVRIFYGDGDELATETDVVRLSKKISNLVEMSKVTKKDFGHNDFVYGKDARELAYNDAIAFLKIKK